MVVEENEKWTDIKSYDANGKFIIRVCNGWPIQLQLESSDCDCSAYVNLDQIEVQALIDALKKNL